MFPILALIFTFAGIAYCAFAPFAAIGQNEAIALVLLAVLRVQLWQKPTTRMGDVIEALWQGLYLTTLATLLELVRAKGLSDLLLPLALGASVTAGLLAFAFARDKPLGNWKDLSSVPVVISAVLAAGAVWYFWQDEPLHIVVVWCLLMAVFFTIPNSANLYEPIKSPSRSSFAVADLTSRMIFAIALSFLLAATEQEYAFSLVGVSIALTLVSAYRIWRWQPQVNQSA